jgi:hypothetical protein
MNPCSKWLRRPLVAVTALLVLSVLGAAPSAHAWKPITHVYLAEEAREELVRQNGWIRIDRTNFWQQHIDGTIGTFPVSPDVYQSLRDWPQYYRAGVLGPDAYPDMLFGQSTIHPEENDHGGADAWLRHLYYRASTPQERAFVLGFLAHAAGDMFAHTFVNDYAGGAFNTDDWNNPRRHIVVEGYLGKLTPKLRSPGSYAIDTWGVNGFIYTNMIDARRPRSGTPLGNSDAEHLWRLTEKTKNKSLPGLFTRLRAGLEDMIAGYYDHVRWLREQIRYYDSRCSWRRPWDCATELFYRGLLWAYQGVGGVSIQYLEAWQQDITRGLRAWPQTNTGVARAMFMMEDHQSDTDEARDVFRQYRRNYLCSMMGAPDGFCNVLAALGNIVDFILGPVELLKELKEEIISAQLKRSTGMDKDEWEDLAQATAMHVDRHVGYRRSPANSPSGTPQYLPASQELELQTHVYTPNPPLPNNGPNQHPVFNVTRFAPAHNTLTAIKLSFFNTQAQWVSVLNAAGWTPPNPYGYFQHFYGWFKPFSGQILLDHVLNLDDGNQWQPKWNLPDRNRWDTSEMLLAADCGLFARFFMQETGDHHDPYAIPRQWGGSVCGEVTNWQLVGPVRCDGFDVQFDLTQPAGRLGAVTRLGGTTSPYLWLPPGSTRSPVLSSYIPPGSTWPRPTIYANRVWPNGFSATDSSCPSRILEEQPIEYAQ